MKKKCLLLSLAGAALLCGCNKQTKINAEKIEALSQRVAQLQQSEARQLAAIQSQMAALAPMLDKMNSSYFEKNHEDEFFYHTNTLFLLLTVDKKIEAHLQTADTEREAEHALAYYYHTNQTDTMYFCIAQIEDALAGQGKNIENNVNAETRRVGAALGEELVQQIKLSAPDEDEIARRKELAADVAQIKRDMETIKVRLGITNQPAAQP